MVAAFVAWPSSTSALVVPWTTADYNFFTGPSCGSTDTVTLRLGSGANRVRVSTPKLGAAFRDEETGEIVARLTDIVVERASRRPAVSFTASGSDDACTNPDEYPAGWSSVGLDFTVTYRTHERVRLGSCFRAPFKPRTIILTCADANWQLRSMRWRRWNGRVARGRGYSYENDCNPFCAAGQFHWYPVRVTASNPKLQTATADACSYTSACALPIPARDPGAAARPVGLAGAWISDDGPSAASIVLTTPGHWPLFSDNTRSLKV